MNTIYLRTLKERRLSMLWWGLGIGAFVALNLAIYPSVQADSADFSRLISNLPDTVRSLFGAMADITSPPGYLTARQYYLLLPIMFIILAIGLGSSLLAREEQNHTLELLLSRPVSRGRLLFAKAFVGLTALLVVNAVAAAVTVILAKVIGMEISGKNILLAHLMLFLLTVLFGTLAFMLTALGRPLRLLSTGVTSLLALLTYILTSLKGLAHWLEFPAKLLPYDYYNPTAILNGSFSWKTALSYTGVITVCGIVAWLGFRRRDIE